MVHNLMPETGPISEQEAAQFRENFLRLQIMCNSLRAIAEDHSAVEAKAFRRFLADEYPVLMQQIENVLRAAIRARGDGVAATGAAIGLLEQDHDRLQDLVIEVCDRLQGISRRQAGGDGDRVRRAISGFVAAQRSFMSWSRKIVDAAQSRPAPPADPS